MAFSDKLLAQGERVELELRTHIKKIVVPFLVFVATVAAAALLLWLANENGWPSWLTWVIVGVGVLVLFVWVIVPFLRWRTTIYVITNRRLITRQGIISKTGRDIPLYRINDVTYEKGVLDRILGCGTLVISDATDKAGVSLHDVPRVESVQLRLNELLFETDDGSDDGEHPPTEPPRARGGRPARRSAPQPEPEREPQQQPPPQVQQQPPPQAQQPPPPQQPGPPEPPTPDQWRAQPPQQPYQQPPGQSGSTPPGQPPHQGG